MTSEGIDIPEALERVDRRTAERAAPARTKGERLAAGMLEELVKIDAYTARLGGYEWKDCDPTVIAACTQLAAQARGMLGKLVRAVAQVEPSETRSGPGMAEFIDRGLDEGNRG